MWKKLVEWIFAADVWREEYYKMEQRHHAAEAEHLDVVQELCRCQDALSEMRADRNAAHDSLALWVEKSDAAEAELKKCREEIRGLQNMNSSLQKRSRLTNPVLMVAGLRDILDFILANQWILEEHPKLSHSCAKLAEIADLHEPSDIL